uniref:Ig-like domain-containing protein n=1 Tax=Maylandia zebra TaxID=106582 RepID=A0A3P9BQ92_9CICH
MTCFFQIKKRETVCHCKTGQTANIHFGLILIVLSHTFNVFLTDSSCTNNPVFTPPALIVKYGDPANATFTEYITTLFWTVDKLTEWETYVMCYYNTDAGDQCYNSTLSINVYRKYSPESASISFVNHTEMMFENQQYTLQCSAQNVAPVQSLTVTFYRGNTALGHLQSNSEQKKPVNETFTLNITSNREDDGAQYWCKTKLELRPAGPQPPPVVTSESVNVTAYCEHKRMNISFRLYFVIVSFPSLMACITRSLVTFFTTSLYSCLFLETLSTLAGNAKRCLVKIETVILSSSSLRLKIKRFSLQLCVLQRSLRMALPTLKMLSWDKFKCFSSTSGQIFSIRRWLMQLGVRRSVKILYLEETFSLASKTTN